MCFKYTTMCKYFIIITETSKKNPKIKSTLVDMIEDTHYCSNKYIGIKYNYEK